MATETGFSSIAGTIAQGQVWSGREDEEEKGEQIDFKMVTFSLGGKDYAVDIMKVKEIAKFSGFTFVPNTMHFVRGVYNLRGEIISVIDLRLMFGVSIEEQTQNNESGLIVRVDDHLLGVVVDSVDRVVGISSSQVQPPHPIFADVNIQYISGVVEHEDRLYILLDVDRIFAREEGQGESSGFAAEAPQRSSIPQSRERSVGTGAAERGTAAEATRGAGAAEEPAEAETSGGSTGELAASDVSFVAEALAAFKTFYRGPINEDWLTRRFEEWRAERSRAGKEVQLRTEEDAVAFVRPFFSPYTEAFWGEDYLEQVERILPDEGSLGSTINVWNPGCGKGYETYSLAVLLSKTYPNRRIKIWASDIDLLSISTAPNLVFPRTSIPDYYRDFIVEGKNGFSFNEVIKELILFEYHDVLHENTVPEVSMIVSRDLLSILPPEGQNQVVSDFAGKLKTGGVIIPGMNEALDALSGWRSIGGAVNAFTPA
ncbi:MAG: CheR family methyltransferase [Spirochaetota bacterium]